MKVITITEETENRPITLNELAERNSGKIIRDNSIQDCKISIAGEIVLFSYKPVKKRDFIKGQATQDEEKFMNYILTHSLWNKEKGDNGAFWSLEELENGIPDAWQILIFTKILAESGFNISAQDLGF
jgi:hypothetical protein